MKSIDAKFVLSKDLTTFKVVGKITGDDINEWKTRHYSGNVTSLHLWDLTQADLSEVSTDDIIVDVERTKMVVDIRKDGKSAFVCRDGLEYGLCRMRETFAEIKDIPIEYETFRCLDEAREWLGVSHSGVISRSVQQV